MKNIMKAIVAGSLLFVGTFAYNSEQPVAAYKNSNYYQSESWEGVITAYDGVNLVINVPLEGEKKFNVSKNVHIENRNHSITVGALVEVETKNNVVYEIETNRSIEGHATVVSINNKSVTLQKNGEKQIYQKATNFYLDKDGYNGNIVNMSVEFTINNNDQITKLEIND